MTAIRTSLAIVGLLVGLAPATAAAQPAPAATIIDLGTLAGHRSSWAIRINDQGVIVGASSIDDFSSTAVRWDRNGVIRALGRLPGQIQSVARDINNSNVAVGSANHQNGFRAVWWDRAGAVSELPPLPGHINAIAWEINRLGMVRGTSHAPGDLDGRPVRWSLNGAVTELKPPPGARRAFATALSDDGVVVGHAEVLPNFETHAVRWNLDGTVTDLGARVDGYTTTTGVHHSGTVVGNTSGKGIRWNVDGTVTELHPLPAGDSAWAYAVNGNNTVVGQSEEFGGQTHPVRWGSDGRAVDLGVLSGHHHGAAMMITDRGVIVGFSRPQYAWEPHAIKWTASGHMTDLGVLPGAVDSYPAGANQFGAVVGTSGNRAVLWPAPVAVSGA